MSAKSKLLSSVVKGYLYKNAARDARKLVKRAQEIDYEKLVRQLELRKLMKAARKIDLDWDREKLLHRIGLTDYEPGKRTLAGLSFFAFGAIAGGIAALAMAPKKGEELRMDVKERASSLFNKASEQATQLSQGASA